VALQEQLTGAQEPGIAFGELALKSPNLLMLRASRSILAASSRHQNRNIMRAIIQRISRASVTIEGQVKASIQRGVLILAGFEAADEAADLEWMARKIANLRIFRDAEGLMNRSLQDVEGEALVVSQFTLHASTKKGNRPSYIKAAKPETAIPLYEQFIEVLEKTIGKPVHTGEFGAMMEVSLVNDGPVTIFIDTKNKE